MKPATAKAKGRMVEQALVAYLRDHGYPYAERRRLSGAHDRGDIAGVPGVVIEVKSAAEWKPVQWCRELVTEMHNDGAAAGFVAARPKATPDPEQWIALLPLPLVLELLRAAGHAAPTEPPHEGDPPR